MRFTILVAAGAGGCLVGGGEVTETFTGATALSIELASGSVTVDSSGDDTLTVSWDGGGVGKAAASPTIAQDGDGVVTVEARGQLGGGDIGAKVPAGVPVAVLLDRGDVTVRLSAPADLDLCVGAGSVSVQVPDDVDYDLDLAVGAGSVTLGIPDVDGADFVISVCEGAGSIEVQPFVAGATTTSPTL
jgi:hypothetical protein